MCRKDNLDVQEELKNLCESVLVKITEEQLEKVYRKFSLLCLLKKNIPGLKFKILNPELYLSGKVNDSYIDMCLVPESEKLKGFAVLQRGEVMELIRYVEADELKSMKAYPKTIVAMDYVEMVGKCSDVKKMERALKFLLSIADECSNSDTPDNQIYLLPVSYTRCIRMTGHNPDTISVTSSESDYCTMDEVMKIGDIIEAINNVLGK